MLGAQGSLVCVCRCATESSCSCVGNMGSPCWQSGCSLKCRRLASTPMPSPMATTTRWVCFKEDGEDKNAFLSRQIKGRKITEQFRCDSVISCKLKKHETKSFCGFWFCRFRNLLYYCQHNSVWNFNSFHTWLFLKMTLLDFDISKIGCFGKHLAFKQSRWLFPLDENTKCCLRNSTV